MTLDAPIIQNMAGTDDLVVNLNLLPINRLENEWVKSSWEKDFVDLDPLPVELQEELNENGYYIEALKSLQPKLSFWVNHESDNEDEVSFWTILVENDISHRNLIAFLASLIDSASKSKVIMSKRHAGLLAACSYFQLSSISGSVAFKVFNPMLLNQCLDVLRKWTFTNKQDRKRKMPSSGKSSLRGGGQGGNKTKYRKTNNNKDKNVFNAEEDEDEEENLNDESFEEEEELSISEINTLYNALVTTLKKFVKFLQKFSLKGSESSIHRSIHVLCELTRPYSNNQSVNNNLKVSTLEVEKATTVVELSLIALKQICSSFQGNITDKINVVSKQLMSCILMLGPNNKTLSGYNFPVAYSQARINAVNFMCLLIKEHGESVTQGVRTLIQHLCVKVPDKTEHRAKVSESIVVLMKTFDVISFAKMVKWVGSLTKTSKVSNRMVGLEILYLLLFETEKIPDEDFPNDLRIYLCHKHLLTYILSRCSDTASSVRAKAITIFSNCVVSENQIIVTACQELFTPQNANPADHPPRLIPTPVPEKGPESTTPADSDKTEESPLQLAHKTPVRADQPVITGDTPFINLNFTPINTNLPDNSGVLSMLKRRTTDEKVNVRKSALQAFESLVRIEDHNWQATAVAVLEERCRDPSLVVRKQAMQSLHSLLIDLPSCLVVQKSWLNGVLPLILDRESSLQEKCMRCVEEVILYNICNHSSSPDGKEKLMWDLLHIMSAEEKDNLRRYFQQAITQWGRAKLIKTTHLNALKTHVGTENNVAAWMLLAELSSSAPKFNPDFVVQYWNENCLLEDQNSSVFTHKCVLTVIMNVAKLMSTDDRQEIMSALKKQLLKFKLPVDIISLSVRTLKTLANDEKKLKSICHELLQKSDKFLSKVILKENHSVVAAADEDSDVICHLFTLGEVAQLSASCVTTRILMLVQSIIASPCITEHVVSKSSPSLSVPNSQELSSVSDSPASDVLSSQPKLSQGSLTTSSSSQGSEPLSQFTGSKWCSRVRGHAFITLGKFCLQNENLAKKCIAAMVRELETSSEEAIRNNVVFILCDLCIRYATLVDQYVSRIAACLNDSSPLIRKQTLTLLTMLIQEDYLKWKGVLFYRFITTLLDDQKEIQEFSEYCLVHCLLVRNPNIMFYHFMECIFYFNNYHKHPLYNRFSQDQDDRNLEGKSKSHLRQRLYKFMLQHMTDEQKFNLSAKLNQDILASVVDGIIPLDNEGVIILQDTLLILGCKDIKLSLIVNKASDENMDEDEMAAAVIATAKKNLVTQVMKKNVIENIVPIVTSLKHLLETKRLPVLKELMLYLQGLMKDFKNEIKEILVSDKQLADEIEFDLRKFEEQQKTEERLEASPVPVGNGNGRRMSISNAVAAVAPAAPSPVVTKEAATSQPEKKSPVNQLVPNLAKISLSRQAILNSAKKSLQKIQSTSHDRRASLSSSPVGGGNLYTTPNTDVSRHRSKENTSPVQKDNLRAISTPIPDRNKNITFGSDQNISVLPPSPIQTNNSSMVDLFESNSLKTPSVNQINDEIKTDIIHLNSPDRAAAPKVWKITPKKSASKLSSADEEEEMDNDDINVSARFQKIRGIRLTYK